MAEDPYSVPGAEGVTPMTLPDSPGDFSETSDKVGGGQPPLGPKLSPGNPFTPLTSQQEIEGRAKANYAQSHLDTLAGAGSALLNKALSEQPRRPDSEYTGDPGLLNIPGAEGVLPAASLDDIKFSPGGFQDSAKDELERTKAEILSYNNTPAFRTLAEFGAAAYGQVGGQLLTPENFVNPFFKVGSAAWRASNPLLSVILGYGVGQAAVQGGADAAAQAAQIRAGVRKEYDPIQTSLAIPTGFLFGTIPAFAKDNQILRYKNIVDDLTGGKPGGPSGPRPTPEMMPPAPPSPDRVPGDIFTPGAPPRAVDITADAPTPSGVLPEPASGMTRIYRAAGPEDGKSQRVAFALRPFENANEYMDVPDHVALTMTQNDRVILPAQFAQNRKPLPEGAMTGTGKMVHPEDVAVDPFQHVDATERAQIEAEHERAAAQEAAQARGEAVTQDLTPKEKPPQTFSEWVKSMGGLKGAEPEIKDLDLSKSMVRPKSSKAKTAEKVLEAAVQQKRLPEGSTLNDVYNILRDESTGAAKHYHPGELGRVKTPDANMLRATDEVDAVLREFSLHPEQTTSRKAKTERNQIREDAIKDVYTNGLEADSAVERATARAGEHGRGHAGKDRFPDNVDIPFDTSPTPAKGGPAGELGPGGVRASGGEPPAAGRGFAASGEDEVAARLREMRAQGVSAPHGSQRPAEGIASANVHAPFTPVESLQDAMTRTINNLKLTVRKGGLKGQGAVGQYDYGTHIIRLKETGPAGVADLAHEMGHDVENTVGRPLKNLIDANEQSMRAFAGDAGANMDAAGIRREGFGEFMSGFITNRESLRQTDPDFTRAFVELMNNENPDLLAQLNRLHEAYNNFNTKPSMQTMTAMTKSTFAVPKVIDNDPLQRGTIGRYWDAMYRTIVAKDRPLDNAIKAAGRIFRDDPNNVYKKLMDLAPYEDPRVWARIYGRGGFNKTVDDLQYGVMDFETMERMGGGITTPINEMLADPITKLEPKNAEVVNLRRDQISAYLIARWVYQLHTQMERGERAMATKMPTSATKGDAETTIREMEQLFPHWRANAELIYAFQKDVVRIELKGGLRTVDEANELLHPRNWEYVPLLRDMQSMTNEVGGVSSGGAAKGLENLGRHARVGSDRDVLNVLESIFQNVAHVNDQLVENYTKMSYRDLLRRLPRSAAAAIGEEIPNSVIRAMDIDVKNTLMDAAKKAGYTTEDARMFASRTIRELGEEDMRVKFYSREPIKSGGRPVIFGWDKGERWAMQFADGDFGRQLVNTMDMLGPKGSQLSAQATGLLVDVMSVGSASLRAGATTTLTYGMKNLVKDSFMQWLLVSEVGTIEGFPLFFRNIRRGATSFFADDEFYRMHTSTEGIGGGVGTAGLQRGKKGLLEMEKQLKIGGVSAYQAQRARVIAEDLRRSQLAGELETAGLEQHKGLYFDNFKKVIKAMEVTETFGRTGLFRAVYDHNIEMGRSHRYAMFDAAMKARDFVDYGRFGSKMEAYSRAIPFLNASIQGIDKFHRVLGDILFKEAVTAQEKEAKDLARRKLLPRIAMLSAASAALEMYNKDDPMIQRLSVQTRSQYWIVRLPFIGSGEYTTVNGKKVKLPEGMQGAFLFIPKPWEPGTIFNLAERATQFLQSGDPNAMKKFAKSIFYTYSVPNPFEMPGLKQGAGLLSNYDTFYDRPIVSKAYQDIAPHLQASEYTNKFYSWVARSLNAASSALGYDSHDVQKLLRDNLGVVGAVLAAPWSPMQAQYLMQGVFGDMPRELGGFSNWVRSLATGDPAQLSDVPGLRAFIKDRMAIGEPMSELYNQIGQNDGRLQIARASFENKVKNGDMPAATTLYNGYDQSQRDYIAVHNAKAGPLVNVLHPLDRTSALAGVVRSLKDGLQTEGGMATLTGGPMGPRIKLEPGKLDVLVRTLNEFQATEARNGLIVQGVPGYKNLPVVNTQPYLKTIAEISPEVGREMSARLAQAKVMPIETVQQFWPKAQKILQAGPGANPIIMQSQLRSLGFQAASQGYEGGGRKAGRGAVDSSGMPTKRAKSTPVPLPAEGATQ